MATGMGPVLVIWLRSVAVEAAAAGFGVLEAVETMGSSAGSAFFTGAGVTLG